MPVVEEANPIPADGTAPGDDVAVDSPLKRRPLTLKQGVKIVFSVALLAGLLHIAGIESTFARLGQANPLYLPVGMALYLLAQAVSTYRWQFLGAALGFRLPFRELYEYYLIGMFFNMFLPGAIGGDAVRMYTLARRCGRRKREALLTLLAERGVGLVALLLLTSAITLTPSLMAVSLAVPLHLPWLPPLSVDVRLLLLALSGALLAGYALLHALPLARLARRFPPLALLEQAGVYWRQPALLFKSVFISLGVHALMVGIHLLIAAALGVHVPLPYITVVYGVVSLASVLPVSANGFGVREGIYWLFLTRIGLPGETALAFAFYWDAISILTSLPGGLLLLRNRTLQPAPALESVVVPMPGKISSR
jgi:uncharacterized membrane protein YbhN (UPF0104 family)